MGAFVLLGEHGALNKSCKALSKNGFHVPAGQMLQRRSTKLSEKTDTI